MERQTQINLWYFVIAVLAVMWLSNLWKEARTVEPITYSEFVDYLKQGKIAEVVIRENIVEGTFKEPLPDKRSRFVAVRVDETLAKDLQQYDVKYTGVIENTFLRDMLGWIIPAAVFFGLWWFVMRKFAEKQGLGGGFLSVGKSKAKVYMEKDVKVTFDDVAGVDEAKDELKEVVQFLKNPKDYGRLGGRLPKGILLVGPPGTGKTLLARAVAGEAGVPFLSINGSEFVEMFVGVGAARVRDLFDQAQKSAPCIVFIDELDALGKARGMSVIGGGNDEREQTLNQLLVQMDGFDTDKGVIIMAATNRPEILDPALLRPGRFDRHVAIDRPDLKGREQILGVHCKHVVLAPDADLGKIAARTAGFVGADLANIVNEAALHAAKEDKEAVDMADFDEAIDRIVGGLEKKNRVMNPKEKETVAYHEAGHTIVAESRPAADRVAKVSIIPRGVAALGYTQQLPTEDRYLLKKSELLDRIDVLLGGRVAEELVFSDVSTGAQNDLQRATDMARQMVIHYGMSETLGLATFEQPRASMFLDVPMPRQSAEYSERTAQAIDDEIRNLLAEAHARVRATLAANQGKLDALAKLLQEREVVDRTMLDSLLGAPPGNVSVHRVAFAATPGVDEALHTARPNPSAR
jgi:cell division protease FtsH